MKRSFQVSAMVGIALLLLPVATNAQSTYQPHWFGTYAGVAGQSGSVDGDRSVARFYHPASIAFDSQGDLFIAERNNHMIRKMTPAGNVSVFAGSGTSGFTNGTGSAARFDSPAGVAVGSDGIIYVADTFNHCIRKITPNGEVRLLAGSPTSPGSADGTGTAASFRYPLTLAVDSNGNVFVADYSNATIRKVTADGVVTTFAGLALQEGWNDGIGTAARFTGPHGLAFDTAGNLFVADLRTNTIRKITPAAVVTTVAGTTGTTGSANGTGAAARFSSPASLAIDPSDNVYIGEYGNNLIRKMTPAAVVTTLAGWPNATGKKDGIGSGATFHSPLGLAVTNRRTLYVADSYNHTIRVGELPQSDFDHDGVPNLVEYAFGLDPTRGNTLQLPAVQKSGGNFFYSFTQPAGVTGVTYGAEWSSTLLPNDCQPIPETGTGSHHTFSKSTAGMPALFLRLVVSHP